MRSHIRLMERKGMLARQPGKARSLRLIVSPAGIPLVGQIAAGSLSHATQDVEGYLPVSPGMFPGNDLFALRVKGDSLKVVDLPTAVVNANATAQSLCEALHVSRHKRGFPWVANKGAATDILIYHSWHCCE